MKTHQIYFDEYNMVVERLNTTLYSAYALLQWTSTSRALQHNCYTNDNKRICIYTQFNYLYWYLKTKLIRNDAPLYAQQERKLIFQI